MKRFVLLVFLLYTLPSFSQAPGCPFVEAGNNATVPCGDAVTLQATFLETGQTNTYSVSSIPYTPPYPFNSGTPIMVGSDDVWSAAIPLPFNFCYFGASYNQIVVGANGCITFDLTTASGYCPYSFTASCPSTSIPMNTIYGPYHDIDPSVGGSIYQAVLGTYPCRTFVVNYYQVPMFYSSCNSLLATQQIVLYEGTNAIEVYIQSAPLCSSWNSGNKMIGIQNSTGTVGFSPPARNTGAWSATNEAWRFMPNGTPNYSIQWSYLGFPIANTDTVTVTQSMTNTYVAQVTYTNCDGSVYTDQDSVTIFVNGPTTSATASTYSVCPGQSVTLSANGANTYDWSDGLGSGSTVTATPFATTTYTVTGTSSGCSSTDTVIISMLPGPIVTTTNDTICPNETASLLAAGASTYIWDNGVFTGNPYLVSPLVNTTYTVTGSIGGCAGTANAVVIVKPKPVISVNSPSICPGTTTSLTASGATSYVWNNGLSSNPLVVTDTSTTTYTVIGFTNGCSDTVQSIVTVFPTPTSLFSLQSSACVGEAVPINYLGNASFSATYNWTFNGGTILSGSGQGPYQISWPAAGTYQVSLDVTENGCPSTVTMHEISIKPIPDPSFTALPLAGCEPLDVSFTNTSQNVDATTTYQWTFGDGSGSSSYSPFHSYIHSGTYDVNLTASTGTCSKTFLAQDYIHVYPIPSAAIETYPPIVSIFEPVIEFSYEATSSVYTQTWILGDGFTTNDPGFEHTFSDTGIFTVYLVLENAQGCIDTMETTVWVRPDYTLYVPNCFTPDADGLNDVFKAYGQGILQFEMNIFNRWGEQLYHSVDLNESWDGKVNGNNAPAGTYIWIIHYTDALHKTHMVNGHVIIFY